MANISDLTSCVNLFWRHEQTSYRLDKGPGRQTKETVLLNRNMCEGLFTDCGKLTGHCASEGNVTDPSNCYVSFRLGTAL